ncbi:hypothetical protein JCM9492_11240 [Aquifex pyrophilus]
MKQFRPGEKVFHKSAGAKLFKVVRDNGGRKVIITDGTWEYEVLRENLKSAEEEDENTGN